MKLLIAWNDKYYGKYEVTGVNYAIEPLPWGSEHCYFQPRRQLRTNYILIDFENVQPDVIHSGGEVPIKVLIFAGEKQTRIPMDLAESLQLMGNQVEYVRMKGNGPNALDFHIAFFLGKLVESDPDGYFHIVSKDKGFDPLIGFLKGKGTLAKRVDQLSDIGILNPLHQGTVDQKAEAMAASLKERSSGRPRKIKTLKNSIQSFFLKSLSESDVDKIVSILRSKKIVKINEQNVTYQF